MQISSPFNANFMNCSTYVFWFSFNSHQICISVIALELICGVHVVFGLDKQFLEAPRHFGVVWGSPAGMGICVATALLLKHSRPKLFSLNNMLAPEVFTDSLTSVSALCEMEMRWKEEQRESEMGIC